MCEQTIKRSFDRASHTYDEHCQLQNQIAEKLIVNLKNYGTQYNNIVDFACGTGNSARALINNFYFQQISAVDISEQLLLVAKNKFSHKNINFVLANFDNKIFTDNSIDLAFCNMGLQWSMDISKAFCHFHAQIKVGGTFAFTMPVEGTFTEIKAEYRQHFHHERTLLMLIKELGFFVLYVDKVSIERVFASSLIALNSIKKIGANIQKQNSDVKKKGLATINHLKNYFSDYEKTNLTYHIAYFILKKQ